MKLLILIVLNLLSGTLAYGQSKLTDSLDLEVGVTIELNIKCELSTEQAKLDIENKEIKLFIIVGFGTVFKDDTETDKKFEKKHHLKYDYFSQCSYPSTKCVEEYNEEIFKFLDKKYGKTWRKKVRSDVDGVNRE